MIRIGYAPGAYDLFHMGHLNLLRRAKERCDFLIAGVVADEMLIQHKKVTPVIPLAERLEIVRNIRFVDMAHAAMTNNKTEIWKELRFNVLFKGDDWRGTKKGQALERLRRARRRGSLFPIHAGHIEQRVIAEQESGV
jgi:glycerol-3-phosphate cytidylyltransferase